MGEEFKILAEHFAEKDNIHVVLEGEDASSDIASRTIKLPEDVPDDMFGVTLATLLHESNKIRLNSARVQPDSAESLVVNILEDIRVDTKVIDKYPNAKGLYADLLEYYEKKHGAKIGKLPDQALILRDIVLLSYGHKQLFDKFKSQKPEVKQFLTDNATAIDDIIKRSKMAKRTTDLRQPAEDLLKLVFGEDAKNLDELLKQLAQAMQQSRQADQELSSAASELSSAGTPGQKESKEAAQAEYESSYYEQTARQAEKGAGTGHISPDQKKRLQQVAKDAREKSKKAQERAEQAHKQAEHAKNNSNAVSARKKYNEAAQKAKEAQAARQALERKAQLEKQRLDALRAQQLQGSQSFSIGFDKIDKRDFKMAAKIPQTLEERLLEFFKNRQERVISADDGRINPSKLSTYYDPLTLFEQRPDDRPKKSRIYFVVDRSGSMGGINYTLCTEALHAICEVINKGISYHGMELEYVIYGFDTETNLVKSVEAPYSKTVMMQGLMPGGGTNPLETLKLIENTIVDDPYTKEFVFLITDGEMDYSCFPYISQQMGGKKKWVFLGVNINHANQESLKLFGEYNIINPRDTQKVLTKAIENTL